MKKTHLVVMLPTENSRMAFEGNDGELYYNNWFQRSSRVWNPQHLYVISDDEIKEGEAYCTMDSKIIGIATKYDCRTAFKGEYKATYKKIVATTDMSLQLHRENTLWGQKGTGVYYPLPQLPDSFIPVYAKAWNEGKPITEIDLEIIDHGNLFKIKPHLYTNQGQVKTREDNTVIVHQSKTYTREDVIAKIKSFILDQHNLSLDNWIEQNI